MWEKGIGSLATLAYRTNTTYLNPSCHGGCACDHCVYTTNGSSYGLHDMAANVTFRDNSGLLENVILRHSFPSLLFLSPWHGAYNRNAFVSEEWKA